MAGPDCAGDGFGVLDHRTELVEFEDFAVSADAFLDVEDGAAVVEAYGEGYGSPEDKPDGGERGMDGAEDGEVEGALPPVAAYALNEFGVVCLDALL